MWYEYFFSKTPKQKNLTKIISETRKLHEQKYSFLNQTQILGKVYSQLGIPNICGKVNRNILLKKANIPKKLNTAERKICRPPSGTLRIERSRDQGQMDVLETGENASVNTPQNGQNEDEDLEITLATGFRSSTPKTWGEMESDSSAFDKLLKESTAEIHRNSLPELDLSFTSFSSDDIGRDIGLLSPEVESDSNDDQERIPDSPEPDFEKRKEAFRFRTASPEPNALLDACDARCSAQPVVVQEAKTKNKSVPSYTEFIQDYTRVPNFKRKAEGNGEATSHLEDALQDLFSSILTDSDKGRSLVQNYNKSFKTETGLIDKNHFTMSSPAEIRKQLQDLQITKGIDSDIFTSSDDEPDVNESADVQNGPSYAAKSEQNNHLTGAIAAFETDNDVVRSIEQLNSACEDSEFKLGFSDEKAAVHDFRTSYSPTESNIAQPSTSILVPDSDSESIVQSFSNETSFSLNFDDDILFSSGDETLPMNVWKEPNRLEEVRSPKTNVTSNVSENMCSTDITAEDSVSSPIQPAIKSLSGTGKFCRQPIEDVLNFRAFISKEVEESKKNGDGGDATHPDHVFTEKMATYGRPEGSSTFLGRKRKLSTLPIPGDCSDEERGTVCPKMNRRSVDSCNTQRVNHMPQRKFFRTRAESRQNQSPRPQTKYRHYDEYDFIE